MAGELEELKTSFEASLIRAYSQAKRLDRFDQFQFALWLMRGALVFGVLADRMLDEVAPGMSEEERRDARKKAGATVEARVQQILGGTLWPLGKPRRAPKR